MKDSEFIRGKVPMTKEVVRAVVIDFLKIYQANNFLDIGAGTGSVSLQTAIYNPSCQVTAIECKDEAVGLIKENIEKFNLSNIDLIHSLAPVMGLNRSYDSVFIGGSRGRLADIIGWAHGLMKPGASLVLTFILMENAQEAYGILQDEKWKNLDMLRLDVSNLSELGSGHYFKANNPTYIIRAERT